MVVSSGLRPLPTSRLRKPVYNNSLPLYPASISSSISRASKLWRSLPSRLEKPTNFYVRSKSYDGIATRRCEQAYALYLICSLVLPSYGAAYRQGSRSRRKP
jgi:hypothetical protein